MQVSSSRLRIIFNDLRCFISSFPHSSHVLVTHISGCSLRNSAALAFSRGRTLPYFGPVAFSNLFLASLFFRSLFHFTLLSVSPSISHCLSLTIQPDFHHFSSAVFQRLRHSLHLLPRGMPPIPRPPCRLRLCNFSLFSRNRPHASTYRGTQLGYH
jgi:hypothetical protein